VGGAWLGWLGAGLPGFFSFLGAVGAISLVWRLARVSGGVSPFTLLLAGAVTNAFAAAVVTFLQAIVAAQDAQRIFFWLIGTLGGLPSWGGLAIAGAGSLVMGLGLWFLAPSMNLLALGEDAAAHGGVEVRSLQRRVFFLVSLGVGLAVAASGLIGFVGMLTPHTLRLAYGSDARRLFPLSALAGASFLVLCDAGARMMFQWFGTEPPVGVITAMLGGPFFLWLLHRRSAQP
jgi:iron complex transport system permease protein